MPQTTDARPQQATLGGWMIVSGSVLLVASLFTTMAELRSLDTRRSVEETLAEPPLDTSGISVEGFLQLLHASALVAGGCAAAMAVLGVYALRRHRPARVLLSVLAVPLFLAGIVAGGLLSSVVAVSVALLWVKPSRDWFDGTPRAVPEAPARPTPGDPAARPDPSHDGTGGPTGTDGPADGPSAPDAPWSRPVADGEATGARPYAGFGTPQSGQPGQATDTLPRPWGGTGPAAPARGDARTRPPAVLVACLVTWLVSGLVALLMVAGAVDVLLNADPLLDEVRRQQPEAFEQSGLTRGALVATIAVMCGLVAVWAIGAIVAAVLAFRGSPAGRTALVVSAAVSGALAVLAGLLQPVLWALSLAALLTVLCLLRPEVRAWYAGRGGTGR
ncbi:hypothetical protein [Nocardioides sp. CFH 31398]|uniref:hypothetical protein n=1 Tax=Nocardioides sp. CFH 31398 TaxID=2919579 RepID=UPI001F06DCB7|nr:hypothetical protein [Nocardioides sp. CFH 31398]MCH1865077.1 hypothetical protein [Nocardioides sp. CFH 31398]